MYSSAVNRHTQKPRGIIALSFLSMSSYPPCVSRFVLHLSPAEKRVMSSFASSSASPPLSSSLLRSRRLLKPAATHDHLTPLEIESENLMLFAFPSVLLIVQNHAVSGMSTRKELAYPFPRQTGGFVRHARVTQKCIELFPL